MQALLVEPQASNNVNHLTGPEDTLI